ncbi:MAG: hypothetical protein ACYC96_12860 [Fimbriimonadaceae bacterium]
MFFFTLFVIGAVGFLTMALLSFGHIGGMRGGHHSLGAGAHPTHGLPGGHLPAHHANLPAHSSGTRSFRLGSMMPTPIDISSLFLGFGAAGIILGHTLTGAALIAAAVAFALAYNLLLIRPAMNFVMKFVSRESKGLEGSVATEAEALGHFDDHGRGIVRLTLDGQIVQLLATLEPSELARGVSVARGDKLFILEVDAARNMCRVSRDLAA